jgi:hypothetical protein
MSGYFLSQLNNQRIPNASVSMPILPPHGVSVRGMEILPPAESIAVLLSKTLERYSNSPFPDLNKLAGIELWTTPNPTVAFLARMSHLLHTRRME